MTHHVSSSTTSRGRLAGRAVRSGGFRDVLSLLIAFCVLAVSSVTLVLSEAQLPFVVTYLASLAAGAAAYAVSRRVLVTRSKPDPTAPGRPGR